MGIKRKIMKISDSIQIDVMYVFYVEQYIEFQKGL